MKKLFPLLIIKQIFYVLFFVTAIIACNNPDNKKNGSGDVKKEAPKTQADSLMADVMEGHNAGMAKYGKLKAMQNELQRLIDSIGKLPSKAKTALSPYKAKMEAMLEDLKSAKSGMDKWMDEFNMDSTLNNMNQRIDYLLEEKLKVSKVKENMLHSLRKADSLIKEKF